MDCWACRIGDKVPRFESDQDGVSQLSQGYPKWWEMMPEITAMDIAKLYASVEELRADISEIKVCMVGVNGLSGLIGEYNKSKGRSMVWGVVGGATFTIILTLVGIFVRYVI